ncbi:gamma-glutamyl hydrolase [Aplysia californica]|uniref:folate gamma-glutamyl hydrolase n=1 Tax=Aplysia californica TaxID=6500 RepID=A0ABM0ZUH6_APLCA|nr:gamma-glutamyl hydrolase [Aplysia californica]
MERRNILFKCYLFWTFIALSSTFPAKEAEEVNNRPIIGLLVKEVDYSVSKLGDEYVEATYVKFLELAGARVVPIRNKQPLSYYDQIFKSVNGVLLPGGATDLKNSSYAEIGAYLYDKAIEANLYDDYFPIWGTCLGFELLSVLTAGENLLKTTQTENMTLPLNFVEGFKSGRLFRHMSKDLIRHLATEPLTQNNHKFSLLVEDFKKSSLLSGFYQILSTSTGPDQQEFISTFEAKAFPFYGTQYHPEKSIFKWQTNIAVNHGFYSVLASQYMADFFVNEARKSKHGFESVDFEAHQLIENDMEVFRADHTFRDTYYFNFTNSKPLLFQPAGKQNEKQMPLVPSA